MLVCLFAFYEITLSVASVVQREMAGWLVNY